jgi:4-hydroxy-tetrahydrodipicolinate synthase
VLSPIVTPFTSDLCPDAARLARHCRWLLDNDVGLAVFGTNSEGNSLTVAEKAGLLDALVEAGLPAARMMPGTGTCALPDTVELTRRAVSHGCGGVLMLPPFYYKDVSDDGLFASFAEVIERVGDARLRVYLYHIPQVSRVPISLALIDRLLQRIRAPSPASRTARATGATRARCSSDSSRAASTCSPAARRSCSRHCARAVPVASAPRPT